MPESTHRQWVWHVRVKPLVFRVLGLVGASLSVFIVFGEIGTLVGPESDISVFSLTVHSADVDGQGIIVFVWFTLGYYSFACLWALFQVRLLSMMDINFRAKTTPKSLSFNCRQIAGKLAGVSGVSERAGSSHGTYSLYFCVRRVRAQHPSCTHT